MLHFDSGMVDTVIADRAAEDIAVCTAVDIAAGIAADPVVSVAEPVNNPADTVAAGMDSGEEEVVAAGSCPDWFGYNHRSL